MKKMSSIVNLDNATSVEKEVVQPIMDSASDYTIIELEDKMKKALQDEINTGRKISFVTAINAIMNVYMTLVLTYEKKENILQTMVFHFSAIVDQFRTNGHTVEEKISGTLDQLKTDIQEYVKKLTADLPETIPETVVDTSATSQAPVQQE
jgi:hypothetical protein